MISKLKNFADRRYQSPLALALVILNLLGTSAVALPTRRTLATVRCTPIGRLMGSGDLRFSDGSLLCKGDRVQPANAIKLFFVCFASNTVLTLTRQSNPDVTSQCSPPPERVKPCSAGNRFNCLESKGPAEDDNQPQIIRPLGNVLIEQRPYFFWNSVSGATSYTVEVSGAGVHWQRLVKGTELVYPSAESAFLFGNAYKVTVVAYQKEVPINSSVAVFNVLSEREVKFITNLIERVNSLNLPNDEVALLDMYTIYMSRKLLNNANQVLESRIDLGSRNPVIYRTLGDIYLEAGLPKSAKAKYEMAATLAKKADNLLELSLAKAGLELIASYNQLPTRINPAQ